MSFNYSLDIVYNDWYSGKSTRLWCDRSLVQKGGF
jgi:hypothetical protein